MDDVRFACADSDVKAVMSMDVHIRACQPASLTQSFAATELSTDPAPSRGSTEVEGIIMTHDRSRCLQGLGETPGGSK